MAGILRTVRWPARVAPYPKYAFSLPRHSLGQVAPEWDLLNLSIEKDECLCEKQTSEYFGVEDYSQPGVQQSKKWINNQLYTLNKRRLRKKLEIRMVGSLISKPAFTSTTLPACAWVTASDNATSEVFTTP